MTVLGIAVNDVHDIPAQTGQGAPFFLGKTDRPGDMALLEIFRLPHVNDDHILSFLNLVAYFDGSGRESHFVREELLRLGRVALDCFSHTVGLFLVLDWNLR
jgi:hypothetical protein